MPVSVFEAYTAELQDRAPLQAQSDIQFWLDRESSYKRLSQQALDLVASPASQAYVEQLFSLCGDLTTRKRNSTNKVSLCRRVFLKLNCHILPWTQCTVNWIQIQIQIQIRTCRARLTNCCYKLKCNLFFVLYNSGRYVAETAFFTFIDLLSY